MIGPPKIDRQVAPVGALTCDDRCRVPCHVDPVPRESYASCPPSTRKTSPLMYEASLLSRKATRLATSSGSP